MTDKPALSTVEQLNPPKSADDIPAALRIIAAEVEAGRYDLLTSAVVVLGHSDERPADEPGFTVTRERYYCFGLGPRHDPFTVRGLLMAAVNDPLGSDPEDEEEPD